MMLLNLFWTFFQVGILSFGGGYAALPIICEKVTSENTWLTVAQFTACKVLHRAAQRHTYGQRCRGEECEYRGDVYSEYLHHRQHQQQDEYHVDHIAQERTQRVVDLLADEYAVEHCQNSADKPTTYPPDEQCKHNLQTSQVHS